MLGAGRVVAGDYSGIVGIATGMGLIANSVKQTYEHSMISSSTKGNVNGGDINFASDSNGFFFYKYSIKQEFAKIIDDYFSTFGYQVNSFKIPNITGRRNWNYVKTNASIVESLVVPEKDLNEYKKMLDSGITFWHNPQTFLDYSQQNDII